MFITKRALPRRTFLRGVGATLALPLLDAMVPAATALAQTAANPVRRLGFIYLPNGVARNFTGINYWTPAGEGTGFDDGNTDSLTAQLEAEAVAESGEGKFAAGVGRHQGLGDAASDGADEEEARDAAALCGYSSAKEGECGAG